MSQDLKEVNTWNMTVSNIMVKCYCLEWLMQVCFLVEGAEIKNAQGSYKDWYLTNWNKYSDRESCNL